MNMLRRVAVIICGSLLALGVGATEIDEAQFKARFAKIGVMVQSIQPVAEVEGLVEVVTNQGTFYATPTGDYFIPGKLYSLDNEGRYQDVAAVRNAPKVAAALESRADEMIVYKAQNERYVVTVFTDISCGFCLKMHRVMQDYNDLGITIRYLAFPRAGSNSDIAKQMANIWCSAEPGKAMTLAKLHRTPAAEATNQVQQCQSTISEQYQLGKSVGVSGTPAVYLPNGMNVGGFLEPQALLQQLEAQS